MPEESAREGGSLRASGPMMALYALLGLLVGVIGSFTHRSRFAIGDVTIWYGIVIALACTLAFAIGLRRASSGMGVGLAFASGVVVGLFVISLGYSHSVVILSDVVGVTWMFAAPIIGFGVALWPRLPLKARPARGGQDQEDAR